MQARRARPGAMIAAAIAIFVVSALIAAPSAFAASSFTVNTTTDSATDTCATSSSPCSLRGAVIAADNAGGSSTITVPAGAYKLTIPTSTTPDDPTTGDLDINAGVSVTLTGAGSASTIINANQVDRAFDVVSGGSLSVSGVTIENGEANDTSGGSNDDLGGAIYTNGTLKVIDAVFNDDDAEDGGDIYADTGATSTTVTGSLLENSLAAADQGGGTGGAIDLLGGTLTVNASQFLDDTSSFDAGAIDVGGGSTGAAYSISGSSFDGNTAPYAGALEEDLGTLTLSGDTFTGNGANGFSFAGGPLQSENGAAAPEASLPSIFAADGGAVALLGGDMTVTDSQLTENTGADGGALYEDPGAGTLEIDHTTIDHNGASDLGGGLFLYGDTNTTKIVDTTIADNDGPTGGGIYENGDVPGQLTNDTIAGNIASTTDGCDGASCGGGIYFEGTLAGILNTIIADNTGGDCSGAAGSADQGHNLDSDGSCFPASDGAAGNKPDVNPDLGPLQDNGGPEPTELPAAGSPAINAGTNAGCPSTDERGVPRPQGGTCDIGAVETAAATLSLKDSAPASATVKVPFTDTITVTNGGPGPSSQTVVKETLPKGETLDGETPSQGTCTTTGSPVSALTCDLGVLAKGASATIKLIVAEADTGTVTNTASATNGEGSSVTASAKTKVTSPTPTGAPPKAVTGVSHVTHSTATIHGSVKTGNESTSYFFQYGTTKQYGHVTPLGRTSTAKSVSAGLSNLAAGTTYHYRLVAVNGTGHSYGRDRKFRTKGHSYRGKLLLDSKTLTVKNGEVYVPFTCDSSIACNFRFSIDTTAEIDDTGQTGPVLVTESENTIHTIGAHVRRTLLGKITPAAQALLRHDGGSFIAKLTARPRSGQRGIISYVRIVQGS